MCHLCDPDASFEHAQEWLTSTEKFAEAYPELANRPVESPSPAPTATPTKPSPKPRTKTRMAKRRPRMNTSYVKSKGSIRSGLRVIQIKVIDLSSETEVKEDLSDEDDQVALSAQYIVRESMDEIMDSTESLVKKIAKTLVNN